jgi:integrase
MRGHVRKRGKASWAVVVDLGRDAQGKRRQKWHSVPGTKRDAERELARLLNDLNTGGYIEPTRLLVRDYLEKWLESARSKVAPKTLERYAEIVKLHLSPALGHHQLAKLHPLHIESYYAEALVSGRRNGNGGLSAQTVVHHHRVVHRALKQAVQYLLIARNPCDAVAPPRPEKVEIRVVNEIQAAELLETLKNTRLFAPTLVALVTGVRRGEALALTWPDIDLLDRVMNVRRSLQQTNEGVSVKMPKSGRGRTVALPLIAVEVLSRHKAEQARERLALGPAYENNGLVFARADGSAWPPDSFTSAFAATLRRAELPHLSFHGLRHSHATMLLKNGINPKVVSERLGHAKVGTTLDIYSHVLPGMQEEAAQGIDNALRKAIEAIT